MRFSSPDAVVFCPDGGDFEAAFSRARSVGVVAHADDLEILAIEGILDGYDAPAPDFVGVVLTDGGGAPKSGAHAALSAAEYRALRRQEQLSAAQLGRYAAVVLLDHSSASVRSAAPEVRSDLEALLDATQPSVLYTHSPFDAHDTHVAVTLRVLEALRGRRGAKRLERFVGGEVWRDLDFLDETLRVAMDVSRHPHLQAALLACFTSQIDAKRYDLGALGRRRAHATFRRSDGADEAQGIAYGVDLLPLVQAGGPTLIEYVGTALALLETDVIARLGRVGG